MASQQGVGGSAVLFYLKVLTRALILPPTGSLILTLLGVILIWRRRRFGWAVFVVGFESLWLLCTPIVADGLSALAERYPALNPSQPVNAQAVVVLGGGGERVNAPEYNGAIAEPILLERLTLAAFLARHYSLPLAVSGAPFEAMAMSETLSRNLGVRPRWIEGNSRDTFENAQLSARILLPAGVKRIVLVTSSSHEWRAAHEFMAAGFAVVPAPAGVLDYREQGVFKVIPSPAALLRSHAAVYELIGEPMRRLQAALGIRERFDRAVRGAAAAAPPTSAVQPPAVQGKAAGQ
ncbi:MAG: YdcF family protein [Steroidobacteraceae bacterium]